MARRIRFGDLFRIQDQRPDLPGHVISLVRSTGTTNGPARLPFCVTPSLICPGIGMLTDCPSPTHFCLGLGPTNPMRTDLASETLGIRRSRFSRDLRYSCPHSHLCPLQPSLQLTFTAEHNAPLPLPKEFTVSVPCLAPVNCPRRIV